MKTLLKLFGRIEIAILLICGLSATIIMFGNAVGRYVFGTSFSWAEEVVRILFVWSMFLAITTGFIRNQHIGFQSLIEKHPIIQFLSTLIYGVIPVFVGFVITVYGYRYNVMIGSVPLAGTNWPTSLFLLPGIFSGVAWMGIGVYTLLTTFRNHFSKHNLELKTKNKGH